MTLRLRRGTDAERLAITPEAGEPVWTTDMNQLWVGDGTTAGGQEVGGGGGGSDSRLPTTHASGTWLESDGTNWLARDDSTARTNLGLGTAAVAATGTGVGEVLAFTTAATLPALDGSALTNLPVAAGAAPLASPTFTGTPMAPTAAAGTDTMQLATTEFVTAAVAASPGAPSDSPTFTGTPMAPTAAAGTNTMQIATTGFVTAAVATAGPEDVPDAPNVGDRPLTLLSELTYLLVENQTQFLVSNAQTLVESLLSVGDLIQVGENPMSRGTINDFQPANTFNPNRTRTRIIASVDGNFDDPLVAPQNIYLVGEPAVAGNYVLNVPATGDPTWAVDAGGGGGGGGVPTAYADSIRVTGTTAKAVTLTAGYWRVTYRASSAGAIRIHSGFDNIEGGHVTFPRLSSGQTIGATYIWNAGDGSGFDYIDPAGTTALHVWDSAFPAIGIGISANETIPTFDMEIITSGNVEIRVVSSASAADTTAVTSAGALIATQIT